MDECTAAIGWRAPSSDRVPPRSPICTICPSPYDQRPGTYTCLRAAKGRGRGKQTQVFVRPAGDGSDRAGRWGRLYLLRSRHTNPQGFTAPAAAVASGPACVSPRPRHPMEAAGGVAPVRDTFPCRAAGPATGPRPHHSSTRPGGRSPETRVHARTAAPRWPGAGRGLPGEWRHACPIDGDRRISRAGDDRGTTPAVVTCMHAAYRHVSCFFL